MERRKIFARRAKGEKIFFPDEKWKFWLLKLLLRYTAGSCIVFAWIFSYFSLSSFNQFVQYMCDSVSYLTKWDGAKVYVIRGPFACSGIVNWKMKQIIYAVSSSIQDNSLPFLYTCLICVGKRRKIVQKTVSEAESWENLIQNKKKYDRMRTAFVEMKCTQPKPRIFEIWRGFCYAEITEIYNSFLNVSVM